MNELEASGINCQNCTGRCCTYHTNSMQMTALETEDLYQFLINNNKWDKSLENKLLDTINEFRLDKEISMGKKLTFRRSYTSFNDKS